MHGYGLKFARDILGDCGEMLSGARCLWSRIILPWRVATNPLATVAGAMICAGVVQAQSAAPNFKFDFGMAPVAANHIQILPTTEYSKELGYGFEPRAQLHAVDAPTGAAHGSISSDRHFLFSVAVPEGNYKVTLLLGDGKSATDTTVNAELRRLMVENVHTDPGKFQPASFIVNVRQPTIKSGGAVRITDREKTSEIHAWDDKLTLEFLGNHPSVAYVEIEKVNIPTLFLMGDSTVCDQPTEPYNSWGQMITRFIKPDIAVSNQAESGESVAGALGKGRLDKIWADMQPGDFLFMQFGHNDMKSTAPNALTRYTDDLRRVVDETRKHGGTPVLFTPVSRRSFNSEGKITNSFNGYPAAVKLVANEKDVPLIDLQALGAAFYEAMGPDPSHKAFANAKENTHHSDYGSYEIAKCVLQRMKDLKLPVADHIVEDFKGFDPSHPDRFEDFKVPGSPGVGPTPLGN